MSESNLEAVRRIYARWESGEMEAGVDRFDSEVHFESFMPDSNRRIVATGPAEVAAFMGEFLAQWNDYRLIADELFPIGDEQVLVHGRQRASGALSGVEVEDAIYSVWGFRDGRVVKLIFDLDRDEALRGAGIDPSEA